MIPDFVTEGLVSPTTSLCLLSITTLVTALNVEISHLRRFYELTIINTMNSDPSMVNKDALATLVPARLPWELRLSHGLGLGGIILVPFFSLCVPSVSARLMHWLLCHRAPFTLYCFPGYRNLLVHFCVPPINAASPPP